MLNMFYTKNILRLFGIYSGLKKLTGVACKLWFLQQQALLSHVFACGLGPCDNVMAC